MRSGTLVCGLVLLAACGSSETDVVSEAPQPELYSTIIEADGVPFEVSWDRRDRTRATARIFGVPESQTFDPTIVIQQATGCRVRERPKRIPAEGTVPTYMAAIDCTPGRGLDDAEAVRSRELAREIDLALNAIAAEPARAVQPAEPTATLEPPRPAQTSAAPATQQATAPLPVSIPVAHVLFEGSAYAQFNATDMERYCAETWETRLAPDGRTEYNPCLRRDAFK
ncbi:MAG: hypothetical protein AAGD13_24205 [Pseudomonadota bacterium]